MDYDQTREDAAYELMSTGAAVGDALSVICDPLTVQGLIGREVVNVRKLCRPEFDAQGQPAHVLMAVMMAGDSHSAMRALYAMRELVQANLAPMIEERAQEMLRPNEDRIVLPRLVLAAVHGVSEVAA